MSLTNSGQSTSLRSRKVDIKKSLAILLHEQQNDIEMEAITSLPAQVTTGVEKGEEEEHHLQAALVARHQVVIPTPDASGLADLPNYEKYYSPTFKLPKAFIKFSQMVEEVIGCLYNVNDEDLEFIKTLEVPGAVDQDQEDAEMKDQDDSQMKDEEESDTKDIGESDNKDLKKSEPTDHESLVLEFEKTMFLLDQLGNEKGITATAEPVSLEDAKTMIEKAEAQDKPDLDQDIITKIYEYWKSKRYSPKQQGKSLLPVLKSEEMSTNPDNDPYVCFRRREIKLQRKVRRSDTLALDKLRKLKGDMTRVKEILDLVKQREEARKEIFSIEHVIFEKRIHLRRLKRFLGVNTPDTLDASPDRSRKRFRQDDSTKIRIPFQNVRDAAALASDIDSHMFDDDLARSSNLKIEEKIKRERAIQEKSGWHDCTEFPFQQHPLSKLWGPHLGIESASFHVSSRRRIGRGGRVIFDRHLQLSKPSVDSRIQDPAEPAPNIFASPSLTMYRGFELDTPKDMSKLLTRETHPSNFDPTKPPVINTTQPEIIRTVSTPVTQKRRPKLSDKSASSQNLKKKSQTPEEMKAAQVKEYLKQAQQQAQMNHQAQLNLQKGGMQSNQGSPLAYASANGPSAPLGPNNRQLSQMLLPSTLNPSQQAQLAQMNYQRALMNNTQPNRLMYIPTMGQSTIHLGPDGMIRMKQDKAVVNEDLSAEMGSFVNDEKEIAA